MKNVLIVVKKIIFAILLLYTYNLIASSFSLIIPINLVTVSIVSMIDFPGLFLLVLLLKLFY